MKKSLGKAHHELRRAVTTAPGDASAEPGTAAGVRRAEDAPNAATGHATSRGAARDGKTLPSKKSAASSVTRLCALGSETTPSSPFGTLPLCPCPLPQNVTARWCCGFFSTFIAWCQKAGQRTSLKSLGTKKRGHILASSRNRRARGVGALNLACGGSSARGGRWVTEPHRDLGA